MPLNSPRNILIPARADGCSPKFVRPANEPGYMAEWICSPSAIKPQVFRTKWDSLDIKELGISSEGQEGITISSPHLLGFWKTVAVAHLRRQQRENP